MSLVRFYVYREKLILPTVEETEAGFYIDSDPVRQMPVKDRHAIEKALVTAFYAGNRIVATPEASVDKGSALLDALNLVKWSSFEKFAVMYTVYLGGRYTTIYATGRGADSMWSHPETRARFFHPTVPASMLAAIIYEDVLKQPEARSERFGLITVPKLLGG
jgi:hypothetical protein